MRTMKKGFTLIELLVVIAIIGILAATILIGMRSARAKARDTQRKNNVRSVINALEMGFDDNQQYAVAGGAMAASLGGAFGNSSTGLGTFLWSSITQSDNQNALYSSASIAAGSVIGNGTAVQTGNAGPVYVGQDMEAGSGSTKAFVLSTAK